MMKKRLLVCGATGFIGRNVAEHFASTGEYEVYGTYHRAAPYDRRGIKLVQTDLTNKEDVAKVMRGMDVIVQAAATTSGAKEICSKPYYHVTDNAVMNSLIFRSAFENNVSNVVFFSCTVMYPTRDHPLKETDFDANAQIFPSYFGVGWTKVYIEKMCEFYSRIGKTKYTVLRHSNVYGPYDKYDLERSHVFGATMTKVMTAKGGKINVWGSGEEARDLIYVSDILDFVEMALRKQRAPFELFNVGCGNAISINDLVKKIVISSGKDLTIQHDLSKPTIKTSLCLDTSRAKDVLGWKSEISLDEGIRLTMDWYRKNIRLGE